MASKVEEHQISLHSILMRGRKKVLAGIRSVGLEKKAY